MTSVCVSSDIFKNTMNTDFLSCTSINKHIRYVLLETIVRPCFDSNTNTFCFALFRVSYSLFNSRGTTTRKSIMKISNKIISIFLIQTHEGITHYNEFNLICIVTKSFELFNSIFCLQIWVVSCPYSSH